MVSVNVDFTGKRLINLPVPLPPLIRLPLAVQPEPVAPVGFGNVHGAPLQVNGIRRARYGPDVEHKFMNV